MVLRFYMWCTGVQRKGNDILSGGYILVLTLTYIAINKRP